MNETSSLFQFELTPIEKVRPWETDGVKSLYWFALTDGWYNIRCGDIDLFRTNNAILKARPDWNWGGPFVDYQVARLHEDLLYILPHVLNPVPSDVVDYVRTFVDEELLWQRFKEFIRGSDDDLAWFACEWLRVRLLSGGYDRRVPHVRFLTEEDTVAICWLNECGVEPETGLAWNAVEDGDYSLSKTEFLAEVREFHERLISEMAGRVEAVVAGCLPNDVEVDIDQLLLEQREERSGALDRALATAVNEDWDSVHAFLEEFFE